MTTTATGDARDEREASPPAGSILTTCTRCDRLHPAAPLEFNPVCGICSAERRTMRSLGMKGSYPLSDTAIAAELTRTSAGNYALGYLEDGHFVVFYVGRSDSDVRTCLEEWVDAPIRYDRYAPSGMAAWGTRRRGASPIASPGLARVGHAEHGSYTHFAYSYAPSGEMALEKECRNYDDFGGSGALDNERAPIASPAEWREADPAHRI